MRRLALGDGFRLATLAPMDVDGLRTRLQMGSAAGRTLPLGGRGSRQAREGSITAFASSEHGWFDLNTSGYAVLPLPTIRGVLAGVFLGNEKDSGGAVAAGACASSLIECVAEEWTRADIVPGLRRFVLRAHDAIEMLAAEAVDPATFPTVGAPRRRLTGIGAVALAVVVTVDEVHGIHVGDAQSFLLRDGSARRLTVPDTLDHVPGQRPGDPGRYPGAEHVVLQVLGMGALPEPTLFRFAVEPGDAILLGSQALDRELIRRTGLDEAQLLEAMHDARPDQPSTLAVIRVG